MKVFSFNKSQHRFWKLLYRMNILIYHTFFLISCFISVNSVFTSVIFFFITEYKVPLLFPNPSLKSFALYAHEVNKVMITISKLTNKHPNVISGSSYSAGGKNLEWANGVPNNYKTISCQKVKKRTPLIVKNLASGLYGESSSCKVWKNKTKKYKANVTEKKTAALHR